MVITVEEHTGIAKGFHHLPSPGDAPDLAGLTLRQALRELRCVEWGDLGGMSPVLLSDGTLLEVNLTPESGGGYLMKSQRAERIDADDHNKVIRRYAVR